MLMNSSLLYRVSIMSLTIKNNVVPLTALLEYLDMNSHACFVRNSEKF